MLQATTHQEKPAAVGLTMLQVVETSPDWLFLMWKGKAGCNHFLYLTELVSEFIVEVQSDVKQSLATSLVGSKKRSLSRRQVFELEKIFAKSQHLTSNEREQIAQKLHLTASQVKTWFQRH